MRIKAHAKLNLGLTVKGKRADGYHELKMITVPIDFFDVLYIEKSDSIHLSTNKWYLPNNEKNTLYQTLLVLEEVFNIDPNYRIKVIKNIPTQAGLGGGSSDAAALIEYLDKQLGLKMSLAQKIEIGLKIGADVPYFMFNKPAVVSGIGEIIEPFELNCPFHLFLVKPKYGISTGTLFRGLNIHQDSQEKLDNLLLGLQTNDYELVCENLVNDLVEQAKVVHPQINEVMDDLITFGFDAVSMTGAGSTIFGLTRDEKLVQDAVMEFYLKYDLVKKSRIIF